jgi:histidine triad (HIT) family protein
MDDCLFCRIVERQLPADIVFEDERSLAFLDVAPQAPVHILVIPRKHIRSLAEATAEDEKLLGHLLQVGVQVASEAGLGAFRTVVNTNAEAGQSVFHLHVHILGGRAMRWPPG